MRHASARLQQVGSLYMTEEGEGKLIPVVELFGPVYQGEGPLVGTQTWFLRTGGCDYRCPKCDSLHAVLPELIKLNSTRMTCGEILSHLLEKMKHTEWLTISGGNPAMWDLTDLVQGLVANNKSVAIETQGTVWRPWIASCDSIVVSPKGPGMGYGGLEDLRMFMGKLLQYPVQEVMALKVPILVREDIPFAARVHSLYPDIPLFLSVGNTNPPVPLAEFPIDKAVLRDSILSWTAEVMEIVSTHTVLADVRVFPQQHVLVYGNERGR